MSIQEAIKDTLLLTSYDKFVQVERTTTILYNRKIYKRWYRTKTLVLCIKRETVWYFLVYVWLKRVLIFYYIFYIC